MGSLGVIEHVNGRYEYNPDACKEVVCCIGCDDHESGVIFRFQDSMKCVLQCVSFVYSPTIIYLWSSGSFLSCSLVRAAANPNSNAVSILILCANAILSVIDQRKFNLSIFY